MEAENAINADMAQQSSHVPPVKSCPATIRVTQDIWCRGDVGQLFPSAAMRLWDHHLHTSGMLPRSYTTDGRIYQEDWVCTYQNVTCFPQEALLELAMEDGPEQAHTHIWVDRIGVSTLYLSQMVTLYDEVLATSVRVLSRRALSSSANMSHRIVPFLETEQEYFLKECAPDQIILDFLVRLAEKYPEENEGIEEEIPTFGQSPKKEANGSPSRNSTTSSLSSNSPDSHRSAKTNHDHNSPVKAKRRRKLTTSSTLSLESFGSFLPRLSGSFLLAVRVGPQNIDYVMSGANEGRRRADSAWLAEVAGQALVEADLLPAPSKLEGKSPYSSMAICFRSVALLGNELRCSLHGDRVCMIRSAITTLGEREGDEIVVLIAKAGPMARGFELM
mmetsp:Transcript_106221/g.307434  ORF Transcript_106221/g.307434 Transcript_106221/m.307434 type:complete len:389 (-) Transcript_106221:101-1267(-)|eukprot:CAMPEP_0176020366 /NCGR_PEP_ID=MMETSP0120_2-20121206/9863_1 /TAXON_ID=160619 /ORGANISM="Kryptoperidinium foliaceum, Strain CCMP 1326" /LENGTH=388 /DNA_ID=CAMNT_0017353459 /DNA_START=91 /DNA_END=1257 /DNA_ORIENTATION=-